MEDNNNIIQLHEALSELLDAYDLLRTENEELNDTLEKQNAQIESLEQQKQELENKVDSLTSTTKHHSTELDTMLGRIKSTLSSSLEKKNTSFQSQQKTFQEETEKLETETLLELDSKETTIDEIEVETPVQQTSLLLNEDEKEQIEEAPKPKEENKGSKEIDLGRMQSLLNGFNS